MKTKTLFFTLLSLALTSCATSHRLPFNDTPHPIAATGLTDSTFWQGNAQTIWSKLQLVPLHTLAANHNTADANMTAWVQLALISKRDSVDTPQLIRELNAWRKQYPKHPGNQLFPDEQTLNQLLNTTPPKHIVVLLPLQGQFAALGKSIRDGIMSAYYEAQSKTKTPQTIAFLDTNKTPDMGALYQQAIQQGADTIIGPLTKEQVKQLSHGSFSVPVIALNYTELGFGSLPQNFYEFGLSPLDENKQLADKAQQAGRSRAIIIAPQTSQAIVKNLISHWKSNGGTVSDTYYFVSHSNLNQDLAKLLHVSPINKNASAAERRHDFDVIFLIAPPQSARQIVPLLRYYYVNNIPIYATSMIYAGKPAPEKDVDLNGVIFSETPWLLKMGRTSPSPDNDSQSNRLFAVGRDAYFISHELPRFTTLPNFPTYGATGALTLTASQQFYRRLPWTTIRDGHP